MQITEPSTAQQKDPTGRVVPKNRGKWRGGCAVLRAGADSSDACAGTNGKNAADKAIFRDHKEIRRARRLLRPPRLGKARSSDGHFFWPSDTERRGLLDIDRTQDLFGIAGGS